MSQMMPPALPPGYPQPQGAAAPAGSGYPMPAAPSGAQGYPGPAVAPPPPPPPAYPPQGAPQPAYSQQPAQPMPAPAYGQPAPAPAYGQPAPAPAPAYAPPAPQPGYAQHPQAQAYGAAPGSIGDAIAAATGGDRAPRFPHGDYTIEVIETIVTRHPVKGHLTFKLRGKVLVSHTNPAVQAGAEYAYIEGLTWGAGRVQDCLIGCSGFQNKAQYDAFMAQHGLDPKFELIALSNAAGDPTNPQPGNKYPPNPLKGRVVRTVVTEYDKVNGARSANPGQTSHVHNHTWAPVSAAA